MDERALGRASERLSRARQRDRRRARARRGRPVHRASRAHRGQSRRLSLAARLRPRGQQSGLARRRLSHAGGPCRGAGRAQQQPADGAVSRRRTAGGGVRHRAADRRGRRRPRHRPHRVAPAQSDRARRVPLRHPARLRLRLGRFRGKYGPGAGARRSGRFRGPAAGRGGEGQAARARRRQRDRARRPSRARIRGNSILSFGTRDRALRRHHPGPGPRDDLRPALERPAWPRARRDPLRAGRHRPPCLRLRRRRFAHIGDGMRGAADRRRQDRRQGQANRRPYAGGGRGRHRVRRRRLRHRRDRP